MSVRMTASEHHKYTFPGRDDAHESFFLHPYLVREEAIFGCA